MIVLMLTLLLLLLLLMCFIFEGNNSCHLDHGIVLVSPFVLLIVVVYARLIIICLITIRDTGIITIALATGRVTPLRYVDTCLLPIC